MEERNMLYKNPVENEERRYRYHTVSIEAYDQNEIARLSLDKYFHQQREDEQPDEILQKKKQMVQDLHRALQKLTKRQHDVLILCAVHGHTHAKAGEILGIGRRAVTYHYKAAILKMRKHMG